MPGRQKIFIEAQRLFRKNKHGMDVVALELLQRFKNTDTAYDITVLVKEDKDHCLQNSETLSIQTLKAAFYPLWEQWLLPRFIAKNKESWLHCTGNTAPLWGKNPLLVTIHDLIFLEENYLFKKNAGSLYQRFGNAYRRVVVQRVAKRSRYIITVSKFQRELIMKRLSVPANKIFVVYNGVDERFFKIAGASVSNVVKKKYGINDTPYIFFLANTEPRKNTEAVLRAFKLFCTQYPQYGHKLLIKGLSAEQLHKKIVACDATAVEHRIQKVGYIDYEDIPVLYQSAAMLWFPSFNEGFGLPIVEAMAGGTPVITSALSVMPEIAGDAALYIDPYKPEELVKQTIVLLTDSALKNTLIEKGRNRAKQFSWDQSIKDLEVIYNKMLNEV